MYARQETILEVSLITTVCIENFRKKTKQTNKNEPKNPNKNELKNPARQTAPKQTYQPGKTQKGSRESQNILIYICEKIFCLPLT